MTEEEEATFPPAPSSSFTIGVLLSLSPVYVPIPSGNFAIVAITDRAWFAIDFDGGVSGDPLSVANYARSRDDITASTALGLARLALRVQEDTVTQMKELR